MRWTKRHSQNVIAAKARKRMTGGNTDWPEEPPVKIFRPRPARPDFIVRIESRFGERLQIAIHRFMGRVRTSDGQSARQFCRGLEQLLSKSA
jgi:hypothetical protein